ncbi:MAG: trypsin-like peptidase domain-containing protein, partial [Patescibacteria group bacterium]
MNRLIFVTILGLFILNIGTFKDSSQSETKVDPQLSQASSRVSQDESGIRIYNQFKNCVVMVETIIKTDSGAQYEAKGSGFFVDKSGHIRTNSHVVKIPGDEIVIRDFFGEARMKVVSYTYWVTLTDKKKKYSAELKRNNALSDLALLRAVDADPQDYTVAKFGNPNEVQIGETVFAIGTPYGFPGSIKVGIVSGLHRIINMNYLEDFIETSAPINFGNSGGPLVNSRGEVIGINSAKIRDSDGMGFAISIRLVNLEESQNGELKLPWFGLEALLENFPRTGNYENPGFQDINYINDQTDIDDVPSLLLLARLSK